MQKYFVVSTFGNLLYHARVSRHYGSSSNESGRLRGNGGDDGSFSDQPQDGSLIVTPEGTKELKVEPIIEDGAP